MIKSDNFLNIIPKTTDILPKHDLVFGTPINDPIAGIPIGDGDTGSLIWFEADAIHININKTDLWEYSTTESDYACFEEEENITSLKHGGELVIKFDSPCFDLIYQNAFEARLSLADATVSLNSNTEFFGIKAKSFASNKHKVSALKCAYSSKETEQPHISLCRWGSKNSWRWYGLTKNDHSIGLGGTNAIAEGNKLYITQKLNGTEFCLGLAIVTADDYKEKVINSHTAQIEFGAKSRGEFTLFWNVSLGKDLAEAKEKTASALDNALKVGLDGLYESHAKQWAEFWNKSLVSIPHDYIENLYYLSLYYSNSECRGAYPPHFTNGIWGFYHDYVPWNYYFHYNMQHMYAPLEPAGHGELANNYYAMRRNGLESAIRCAKELKGEEGAFFNDILDCHGYNLYNNDGNCTPGAQVAMAMYRHYRMNGDTEFFYNTALPVMKESARFYLSKLKKGDDGLYHIYKTTAYEGTPLFDDTITDYVMIRSLFGTLLDCPVTDKEKEAYKEVLSHLPDYTLIEMFDDEKENGVLGYGIGKGKELCGDGRILTIGTNAEGKIMRRNFGDLSKWYYGFPDTEMSPLYPAGVFGLRNQKEPMFGIMLDQIRLHPHPKDGCMQWCMMPIYMARMGMGEELYDYIEESIDRWMIFPNGFGADCPEGVDSVKNRLRYSNVRDAETKEQTCRSSYVFRHFDMETLPIIAYAVSESLLQSYDGVLRICPSVTKNSPVKFRLFGEGGFCVTANIEKGKYRIIIDNLRGEECYICLPEDIKSDLSALLKKSDNSIENTTPIMVDYKGEEVLTFADFKQGDSIIITNFEGDFEMPVYQMNKAWKTCKDAHLGTPATC